MKQAILDTNFIMTCIRNKIDFFEEITFMGIRALIPLQVIDELRKISRMGKGKFKDQAKFALSLLENTKFNRIDLYTRNVDEGILKLARENKNLIIATLDRGIKNRTENQKLVIRDKKKLEII